MLGVTCFVLGQTKDTSSGATAVNPLFRNAMWTIAYGGDTGHNRSEYARVCALMYKLVQFSAKDTQGT